MLRFYCFQNFHSGLCFIFLPEYPAGKFTKQKHFAIFVTSQTHHSKHMKKLHIICIALFLLGVIFPVYADSTIKVACVGNSITYGAFIPKREINSYPAQLQTYLGSKYEVRNFGVSGCTLLKQGDFPYTSTDSYQASLAFQPDIVFIKLGTNDSKPQNRIYLQQFKTDYLRLIESYCNLPSRPRIILLTPIRCFLPDNTGISDSVIQTGITPVIKQIAYEQNLEIINLYYLFGDQWQEKLIPDKLHPSSEGASMIASRLYTYLTSQTIVGQDIISRFPLSPVREFNFHGFQGYVYNNQGIEYYIVKPHRTATHVPWIWRARFWGHEPQTDLALLEQGFHLTYCNVANLYGSPEAVKRWNNFYKLAIQAGLNKKVALEGMSRGGLIVYNWAAANPGKVACIYADAPVMDFKSWPLGKGASSGSAEDTRLLLTAYGFSNEQQALKWKKNPIDHAGKLAKAGIPILHVVGDADEVVPVKENTDIFAKRLKGRHYTFQVIHKPGIGHHPHSLNNPQPITEFILNHTIY